MLLDGLRGMQTLIFRPWTEKEDKRLLKVVEKCQQCHFNWHRGQHSVEVTLRNMFSFCSNPNQINPISLFCENTCIKLFCDQNKIDSSCLAVKFRMPKIICKHL